MSLQTDIIFVKALRSNAELIEQLPAGDVYNTAIALPDEAKSATTTSEKRYIFCIFFII